MKNTSAKQKIIQEYIYGLDDALGQGHSSVVYKGFHMKTKQPVGVKVVNNEYFKIQFQQNLIQSEYSNLSKLDNKNILKLIEVIQTKNNLYIITELCSEGDLKTYLEKNNKLTESKIINIIKQIVNGLLCLNNNNIVHRDIKPDNIFMDNGNLKIADFGFSKQSNEKFIREKNNVGSPVYMAPEALNNNTYSSQSDVWSLGIILYEILTRSKPWRANSEAELKREICQQLRFTQFSKLFNEILQRCLTVDVNQRASIQMIQNLLENHDQKKIEKLIIPNNQAPQAQAQIQPQQKVAQQSSNQQLPQQQGSNSQLPQQGSNQQLPQQGSNQQLTQQQGSNQLQPPQQGQNNEANSNSQRELRRINQDPKISKNNIQNVLTKYTNNNKNSAENIPVNPNYQEKQVNISETTSQSNTKILNNSNKQPILKQINQKQTLQNERILIAQINFMRFGFKIIDFLCQLEKKDKIIEIQTMFFKFVFKQIEQIQSEQNTFGLHHYQQYRSTQSYQNLMKITQQYNDQYQISYKVLDVKNQKDIELQQAIIYINDQLKAQRQMDKLQIIVLDYMVTFYCLSLLNRDYKNFSEKSNIHDINMLFPKFEQIEFEQYEKIQNKIKQLNI